jgi:pyruvate formate lyase activating enzyme
VKIGGLQKLTLIDYPQKIACTVFLSGCNFRCPWCYSPELVLPEKIKNHPEIKKEDFFDFLEKRKRKLDGVVICGGEPTVAEGILDFIKEIKKRGFLVKIDTNGSRPEALKEMIELVNYIAMDVKFPLLRYKEISNESPQKIKESIDIIMNSNVDYEFRTTVVPGVHFKEDIEEIAHLISGAKRYYLQNFLPEKTIEESFLDKKSFSEEELKEFKKIASSFTEECQIR